MEYINYMFIFRQRKQVIGFYLGWERKCYYNRFDSFTKKEVSDKFIFKEENLSDVFLFM